MKKLLVAALVVACALRGAQGAVYVSPAGAGLKDGSSAPNAYDVTKLQTACTAAASTGDKTVILAGGVYYTVEDTGIEVPDGISIVGSDDPTTPTILCGDVNQNDVWDKFSIDDYWTAATNGQNYARIATDVPVLKDGLINLPADAASLMYFVRYETRADNRKRCLVLKGATARTIQDITITGYGIGSDSGSQQGCAINIGGANTTLRRVKVIGNQVGEGGVQTNGKSYFYDCEFSRNQVANRGSYEARAQDELYNCRFVSNYKIGGSGGPSIYFWGGSSAIISNCWFELNECGSGSYRPSPCIAAEGAGSHTRIMDCTFTNNLSIASCPTCINSGNFIWRIENCRMVGNTQVASGNGDVQMRVCVGSAAAGTVLDGCTLAHNRACFRSTGNAVKTVAAAPYLLCHYNYDDGIMKTSTTTVRSEAVNCLFYDNAFSFVGNTNNASVRAARAVGYHGWSSEAPVALGIAHCTFAGSQELPDISLSSRCAQKLDSVIVDSVFSGPAPSAYRPVVVSDGQPILFVSNTTAGVYAYPASATVEGMVTDDPLVVLPSGEMSARTEGRRTTCPVSWFESSDVRYYVYEYGGAARHLNPGFETTAIPAADKRTYISDLAKAARPTDGTALRGALETMDAAGATKKTVVYRISPAGTATMDGLTGYTQLLASGGDGKTFSFVAASDRISFKEWQTADGTFLSNDVNWKPTNVTEDTTVVAVFSAPKIRYTFDLGASGTFVENGASTIVKEYTTGDVPAIPAYAFDTEHYVQRGWDKVLPEQVGTDDLTFTMNYFERKYRIVRYDSHAVGGTGDGSTWANAMTNLQEALDLAGISGGEVRVKKGVHYPCKAKTDTFVSYSGVKILGGFDGGTYASDAAELAARDVKANETIFSGDISKNDCWQGKRLSDGAAVWVKDADDKNLTVIDANGRLNAVNPDDAHRWWSVANTSDNAVKLFDLNESTVDETCVFDGLSFSGFTDNWLYFGSHAHPSVLNCTFVGSGTCIFSSSWSTISNCCFYACGFAIWTSQAGPWDQRVQLSDSLFDNCSNGSRGALAGQGGKTDIRRCTFRRNWSTGTGSGGAAALGMEQGFAWVWDSIFERNVSTTGGPITRNTYILSNCVFRCNRVESSVVHLGNAADEVIRDCSFYSNVVSRVSTATSGVVTGAILEFTGERKQYVNNTFADNVVTGQTAGATRAFGTVLLDGNCYGTLSHCTFVGNVADAEFVENARSDSRQTYLVNDILSGEANDYVAYAVTTAPTGAGRVHVYESTMKNLTTLPSTFVTAKGILTGDAEVLRKTYGADGHVRVTLSAASPSARSGRNFYATANGTFTFNAAEPGEKENWIVTKSSGSVTKPYTLLPDALGNPRRDRKVTRGALEAGPTGMLLIVR